MKKAGLLAFLLSLSALSVRAQVSLELLLEQDQFLPGETLKVSARITNRSGQTLHLGKGDDWLTFSIESREGIVVPRMGEVPVAGEFDLESSRRGTKHVDLSPYFALSQPGRYSILATLKIKDWDREIVSQPKFFNLIEGSRLWEQEIGLPLATDAAGAKPEVRKYILQQANYIKGQLRLYLRVTDAAGMKAIKTVPIGTMLSFSRPETRVDKVSNLHLLYQSWAHSFSYSVFNPDGELVTRQSYDYTDGASRPKLQTDSDGSITVTGGIRRTPPGEPLPAPPPPDDAKKPSQ